MKRVLTVLPLKVSILFLCFITIKCRPNKVIDLAKVDRTYFLGSYSSDLDNKVESVVLKSDGYYDYYWKPGNRKIENVGKWVFLKGGDYFIGMSNFPNYRQAIFPNEDTSYRFYMNLSIDVNNNLGDLTTLTQGGRERYIFKPGKRKD